MRDDENTTWSPAQLALLKRPLTPAELALFAGARGGGKTNTLRAQAEEGRAMGVDSTGLDHEPIVTGVRARLGRTNRYVPECGYCRGGLTECPEHGVVRAAPAPPAPAEPKMRGLTKDEAEAYDGILKEQFSDLMVSAPAPAPEATGEMKSAEWWRGNYQGSCSTADLIGRALTDPLPLDGPYGERIEPVRQGIAALRARASEAEERASKADRIATLRWEYAVLLRRERDEAREQIAKAKSEHAELLGNFGDASDEIERLRSDLAAANARAEEAERELAAAVEHHANARRVIDAILPNEWPDGVSCWQAAVDAFDTERTARLRAEAERDEAKVAAFYAFVAGAKWWEFAKTGGTMWPSDVDRAEEMAKDRYPYAPHGLVREAKIRAEQAEERLAAAEAEVTVLREECENARHANSTFDGQGPLEFAAAEARIARLVEIGDRMAESIGASWPALTRGWAAAKADAPAAGGGR